MPKFSIFNARSGIIEKDGSANQTFYSFCRSVWDALGGGSGKIPELEIKGNVGFFGKNAQPQAGRINSPQGGETIDVEARQAIEQIIQTLQNYGLTKEK